MKKSPTESVSEPNLNATRQETGDDSALDAQLPNRATVAVASVFDSPVDGVHDAKSGESRGNTPSSLVVEATRTVETRSKVSVLAETSQDRPLFLPNPASESVWWSKRDIKRLCALAVATIIAIWFLSQVESILPPFILSFALAALLDPTLRSMERWNYSRVRAILALYLLGFSLFGVFVAYVVPLAITQVEDLSQNSNSIYTNFQTNADRFLQRNEALLKRVGIRQTRVGDLLREKSGPVQKTIGAVLGGITGFVQNIASKLLWFIIIPIATFFFMKDYPAMRARIISLFPEAYQSEVDMMSRQIVDVFINYLRGLAKVCALYGVTAVVLFYCLGLNYALFLGLLAGLFYAIPYVGQLFTATTCAAVAYSMDQHTALLFLHVPANSAWYTVVVILSVVIANNTFDQILTPKIVGGAVGLHPVVSIFALMAGATLYGIWGMLLAVPVAASIQLVLRYFFPKMTQPLPAHLLEVSVSSESSTSPS